MWGAWFYYQGWRTYPFVYSSRAAVDVYDFGEHTHGQNILWWFLL